MGDLRVTRRIVGTAVNALAGAAGNFIAVAQACTFRTPCLAAATDAGAAPIGLGPPGRQIATDQPLEHLDVAAEV